MPSMSVRRYLRLLLLPLSLSMAVLFGTSCQAADELRLERLADGFERPIFVTSAGDGSGSLYVLEQTGRIYKLNAGDHQLFLDVTGQITSSRNEQGLLALAFHPQFESNRRFFIYYTATDGDNTLAELSVDEDGIAIPGSLKTLFAIPDPASNHNGGTLAFGQDGYLYISMGDGGRGGDPWNNAQNLESMLGKIHRIDVNTGEPYGIPANNPFTNTPGARPEIWAYGLRNPWRMSFDRETGALWIGDVGQESFEEINRLAVDHPAGANLGWRLKEGTHCYLPARNCEPESLELVDPVAEYDHGSGCSVTGGYVYRGSRYPDLRGTYLFGDYCSGVIWGMSADGTGSARAMLSTGVQISSFGEDASGELYLVAHGGQIYRIHASR